jgi:hypothetical protein
MRKLLLPLLLTVILGCNWDAAERPSADSPEQHLDDLRRKIEAIQQQMEAKKKALLPLERVGGRVRLPEVDATRMGVNEAQQVYQCLLEYDASISKKIEVYRSFVSDEERAAAHKRNATREFEVGPEISQEDIQEIIHVIEDYDLLDPRILSMRQTDEKTVEVRTGVIRGPLDANGMRIYLIKRESGWQITHTVLWCS